MATMIDSRPVDYEGEKKVYDCLKEELNDSIICYYNREVNGHEFDFCLLVKNMGLMIIEVKGWNACHIVDVVNADKIILKDNPEPVKSPKKQARGYQFALSNILSKKYGINPLIVSTVCYPFISEIDYKKTKLNIVSEPEITIFADDLSDSKKLQYKLGKIFNNFKSVKCDKTIGPVYDTIRGHFESEVVVTDEIYDYSEVRAYKNNISITDISDIFDKYCHGVKEIIFVKTIQEMNELCVNLNSFYKENNIVYSSGNLTMNNSVDKAIEVKNNKILSFIFEAYLVEDLDSVIDDNLCIKNGKFKGNEKDVLAKIAEKCNFNYQQYLIEHSNINMNLQIKAGAGTGKTYSMVSRISFICNLISNSGVLDPSEEIAMLTFTDEAAINMRNRIKLQFCNYFVLTKNKRYMDLISSIERMRISTIHSFAKDIIKRTSIPLGIGTDFSTVVGNYQRRLILRRYLSDYFEKKINDDPNFIFNLPVSIYDMEKFMLNFIEKSYNKGIDLKEINSSILGDEIPEAPYLKEIILDVVVKTEIEYSNYLVDNNSVNLNEYMIYLNKCINDETFNPRLYHFKYIFIDEFQDVDDSQIATFKVLNEKIDFKYFIVGDLKQSIYRFRGATMDAFTKMDCNSDKWLSFSLNTNYRSDKRLLLEYQNIFSKMGDAKLIPFGNADYLKGVKQNDFMSEGFVEKIVYTSDEEKEDINYEKMFDSIKDRISELEAVKKNKKLSMAEQTIAILVRKNFEVANVIKHGKEFGITVESDKNTNLYKLQSTIDLCKLTSALCNPYNTVFLYDLIQSNNINIKFNVANLLNKSDDDKLQILIDCLDCYFNSVMGIKWNELINDVQKNPTLQILRKIYEKTKPWKKYSNEVEKQIYYRINYELVFEELARSNRKSYLTLESINEALVLATTKEMEAKSRDVIMDEDRIRVVCMTVHASKGLEYDTVILPFTKNKLDSIKKDTVEISTNDKQVGYCFTFNETRYANQYFDKDSEIEENVKEESRILYVALTRAINKFVWLGKDVNESYNWAKLLDGDNLWR